MHTLAKAQPGHRSNTRQWIAACLRPLAHLCAGTLLLAAVTATAQTSPQRLARLPASGEASIELSGSGPAHLRHAETVGRLPADTPLAHLSLVLRPSAEQDAALTQLLADQQDPSSPGYHQWLTPGQFGSRFGAADADMAILVNWLQDRGFTVNTVAASHNSITFSGSASAAERAFSVSLQQYRRGGREFFENTGSIHLPASLATVVSGVTGLSSYRLPAPQTRHAQPAATPDYTTSTAQHYLVPWDFRQIFGINALVNSGFDGTGIKIGVIGQSAVDTTQLTYFQQKTGQTAKLPTMVLVPNTGSAAKVSGDEEESELDLEYASGTAPGAAVQFIYTGCSNAATGDCGNNGIFDALSYAITSNLAPILSLSYGGCEAEDATYATGTVEPLLRQANAQGQTLSVSSGDTGAASCEQNPATKVATAGLSVSYPASSPYVTGIGGTQIDDFDGTYWSAANNTNLGSALGYIPETSWNDTSSYGSLSASGGGASKIFTKPAWQVGTGVPSDGQRDVPDVAFPASVSQHAYVICDAIDPCLSGSGGFVIGKDGGGVGGTSASAPNFAAMLAVIEQSNGGNALGNPNPSFYALAEGTSAATIFHDITNGTNTVACATGSLDCTNGSIGYSAGTGYDQVTGLGSINAPALRNALAGYASTTARVSLSVNPGNPTVAAATTFNVALTGSHGVPTGTVSFAVDGAAVASGVGVSAGSVAYVGSGLPTSGFHTVSAAYSGDGTYAAITVSLTVYADVNTPVLSITANPSTAPVNSPITFTASVTGNASTPAGSVTFTSDDSTLFQRVPLLNGTATYVSPGLSAAGIHQLDATYVGNPSGTTVYKSVGKTVTFTVTNPIQTATPTVQVTASPATISPGGNVQLTATVTGSSNPPTGRVIFTFDGAGTGNSAIVSGIAQTGYNGFVTAGAHTVQAMYSGDNTYLSKTASVVISVANPGISLSSSSSTLTVANGSSGILNATVASTNGFAGQVGFRLSLVSYTGAAFTGCYTLSPSTVLASQGGSASTAITLYTSSKNCSTTGGSIHTVESAAPGQQSRTAPPRNTGLPRSASMTLAVSIFGGCFFRRRKLSAALLACLLALTMTGLSGCGSGSSSATPPSSTTGGGGTTTGGGSTTTGGGSTTTSGGTTTPSPTGTYVIRVTATGATNATITASTQFTLTVQ